MLIQARFGKFGISYKRLSFNSVRPIRRVNMYPLNCPIILIHLHASTHPIVGKQLKQESS